MRHPLATKTRGRGSIKRTSPTSGVSHEEPCVEWNAFLLYRAIDFYEHWTDSYVDLVRDAAVFMLTISMPFSFTDLKAECAITRRMIELNDWIDDGPFYGKVEDRLHVPWAVLLDHWAEDLNQRRVPVPPELYG